VANRLTAKPRRKSSSKASQSAARANSTPVTYRDIAWWAEAADGLRDKNLVIAKVKEDGEIKLRVKERSKVRTEDIVIDGIRTESTFAPKRPVTKVMVRVGGKTIECKSEDGIVCDSIFCTESSIEKFLFLYYHSQRLLTDEQWNDLYAALNDPDVVVIGHVWPSRGVPVHKPDEEEAQPALAGTDDRFYVLKAGLGVTEEVTWQPLSKYERS
jgi:hypothetical protein